MYRKQINYKINIYKIKCNIKKNNLKNNNRKKNDGILFKNYYYAILLEQICNFVNEFKPLSLMFLFNKLNKKII